MTAHEKYLRYKAYQQEYRKNNKFKVAGYAKKYQSTHKHVGNKAQKRYREKNREALRQKYYDSEKYKLIVQLKSTSCVDCRVRYNPWVMTFDHRNPQDKSIGIAQMRSGGFSIQQIKDEASKCDVVCANCHADRTHKLISSGFLRKFK